MKWIVQRDGAEFELDADNRPESIVEVEPGVYSVLRDGASFLVRASGQTFEIGSRRFEVEVRNTRDAVPRSGTGIRHGRVNVTAPMPGRVIRVLVQAGEEVAAGQGLVVVEAMKMQNEMKTPRAGAVIEVKAAAGDTVSAGQALVIIE